MALDLPRFYRAANPSRPLRLVQTEERQYYIDFSSVRGGDIVRELERTITLLSPDEATTQLFTGNIGCGKSTELLRLKAQLEQQGLHVVYFESDRDLEMADVDISDILLMIAHQVVESLENDGIKLKPSVLVNLFRNLAETLQTPMEIADVSFSVGIAAITARAKESPEMRSRMRQYLEPRTKTIIDAINEELLEVASATLRSNGKKGLVVIVDNLDRIDPVERANGRTQSEYLFIDRGEQLKRLNCHLVYTIPLTLVFSDDLPRLSNRFGVSPKVLPMVPVTQRDGSTSEPGLALLQQMVLARAFPDKNYNERIDHISDIFENINVLNRLCRLSGGHMRNLMRLLYGCLQKGDPPLQSAVLEAVIRDERDSLMALIDESEWQLMFKAVSTPDNQGNEAYSLLLRSLFLYEYRDNSGRWFDINPVLKETKRFQNWHTNHTNVPGG